MSWTQERLASALSYLDAPSADEAFWERVHSDLLAREPDLSPTTNLLSSSDQPMTEVQPIVRSPRGVRWYVAASAAAAVLIAGLYAIGRDSDQTPGDSPTRTDVVLTDRLSLSLDDQPRTAPPVVSKSVYVVPDLTQLPEAWTATELSAFGLIWPPNNGYRAVYSMLSPTGTSYTVDVMAGISTKPDDGTAIDVNGHDGLQTANSVWWEQEPGVGVTFTTSPATGSDSTAEDLVGAARGLVFARVKELPIVSVEAEAAPPLTGADFAGTLSGVRYAVNTNRGPLRGIRVVVGDHGGGGVEDDRLSQPTDDPEAAGSVNIVGVAGYGAIAFGYTEPATAGLRVNLADGSTIRVPVLRKPGETYFALPIPLGVDVTTLDFLDPTDAVLRSATMPTLPAYFGACCANAPWTTDLEPASPSATPTT